MTTSNGNPPLPPELQPRVRPPCSVQDCSWPTHYLIASTAYCARHGPNATHCAVCGDHRVWYDSAARGVTRCATCFPQAAQRSTLERVQEAVTQTATRPRSRKLAAALADLMEDLEADAGAVAEAEAVNTAAQLQYQASVWAAHEAETARRPQSGTAQDAAIRQAKALDEAARTARDAADRAIVRKNAAVEARAALQKRAQALLGKAERAQQEAETPTPSAAPDRDETNSWLERLRDKIAP
jgi:hypothetical protein